MKLEQLLLVENNLDQFRNADPGSDRLGQNLGATELQVTQIKQALKRHRLALGERPEGSYWQSEEMAWTGDESGVWTAALSRAIRRWKESIVKQIRGVQRARSINVDEFINNNEDLFYLLDAELIPANQQGSGFLRVIQGRVVAEIARMGARIDFANDIVVKDVNQINSLADMVNGIGYSGWIAIITPILNQRFPPPRDNARVAQERDQLIQTINVITGGPGLWWDRFRSNILSTVGRNFAVDIQGERVKLLPPLDTTTRAFPHKHLYLHFANIASELLKAGAAVDAERQEQGSQDDADRYANDPTGTETQYIAYARQLVAAFKNDLLAGILPGGRTFDSDSDIVEYVFQNGIRAAVDYDKIAEAYANLEDTGANANLGADLVENLTTEEYFRIVRIKLTYVRRIAPTALHTMINFAGEENVSVNIGGSTYLVGDRLLGDRVQIEPEVKDCILEDAILRQAITESGGEIPNLFTSIRDVSEDTKLAAANLFINAIESTYPELVPWYTNQEPFSRETFDLGGARLREIFEEISLLLNAGSDPAMITQRVVDMLEGDRIWLVGDGSEDKKGNANITFDARYRDEGLANRYLEETPDPTDLDDDDLDLITRMADDREDISSAAIQELGAMPNSIEYYMDTVYRGFKQEIGKYPDLFFTDNDKKPLSDYLTDGTYPDGKFGELIRALNDQTAIAAPSLTAQLFEDSMEGRWWELFGGTNEDLMKAVVDGIKNREYYLWVNEFYDGNLFADVKAEQSWTDTFADELAAKIGESFAQDEELGVPEDVRTGYQEVFDAIAAGEEITQEMYDGYIDAMEEYKNNPVGQLADMLTFNRQVVNVINDNIEQVYGRYRSNKQDYPDIIRDLYEYNQNWFAEARENLFTFRPAEE